MAQLTPDPLCKAHDGGYPLEYLPQCICRVLHTARLQGPVKDNRHAPICWCDQCMQASAQIHGTGA